MSWRDLLQTEGETVTLPWVGGRSLRGPDDRVWAFQGPLPREFGWYRFNIKGRKATGFESVPAEPGLLGHMVQGYLVGDRIIADGSRVDPDPRKIASSSESVALIEDGLDRFVRISAGRLHPDGPLIFHEQEMPVGPEDEVLNAFLDKKASVDDIAGVTPALDAAFRMESHQRAETERRRQELEQRLREEEERRQREERRRQLVEQLGDGAGRRAMAAVDFDQAAKAALEVGGAELLDVRRAPHANERVIRFRMLGRRFECICEVPTLRIVDAGICLTAHHDDGDFTGGTKGDTWFTLESLPGVIRQANDERKLVVFRHV